MHQTVNLAYAGAEPARSANMFPSSSGLGHPPFTQVTRVRLPLETYLHGIVVQWLERSPVTGEVVGSSPIGSAIFYRGVAQPG